LRNKYLSYAEPVLGKPRAARIEHAVRRSHPVMLTCRNSSTISLQPIQ
jgi:hypothetical protein